MAREHPRETKNKASDRELVARLVDQARAEGVELVGENGLLGRLTISTITDKVLDGMAE